MRLSLTLDQGTTKRKKKHWSKAKAGRPRCWTRVAEQTKPVSGHATWKGSLCLCGNADRARISLPADSSLDQTIVTDSSATRSRKINIVERSRIHTITVRRPLRTTDHQTEEALDRHPDSSGPGRLPLTKTYHLYRAGRLLRVRCKPNLPSLAHSSRFLRARSRAQECISKCAVRNRNKREMERAYGCTEMGP